MLEKTERTIGSYTYTVTQLPAKVGNRVLLKLAKGIGPLFMVAAASGTKFDASTAAGALKDLSEDDFDWIVAQLASRTDVNLGDKSPALSQIFDLHFAGRYEDEFVWLEFALEVNFGPFFVGLKKRAAAAVGARETKTTASSSTSPLTSTGASSAS